ncbi:MAG TPA: HEAT repeat domain-containing protein, partial [Gemmatimonadaceae bacterium]|nr:HEAT repeat domain-containing protein [Gemmatimonadaceae bacterium]
ADSLWRAGRRATADEDWDAATETFARIRSRYPKSAYVGDSYYWQAYALYQKGGSAALRDAVTLLDAQRNEQAGASTVRSGEAQRLATRIRGALAQSGDSQAAEEVIRRADAAVKSAGGGASGSASDGSSSARRGARSGARGGRQSAAAAGCPAEEDDDRVMALNALLQMRSDDAMPLLKQVLARRDACSETLRRKAVFLVSQKRSEDAADILMDAAQHDPDAETREQAVFWLSQVNTARSTTLLEQILKTTKDEGLQDKAIFALSQGHDPRRAEILRDYADRDDAPEHLREQAVFWLGQGKGEENGKFLRDLFGRAKNAELKNKILFSLSQQRSDANDQFLLDQAVNTSNAIEVRKQALFWAGQNKSVDVARLGAIYDKGSDPEFREQVIFVLSQRSRDPAAIDKLIDIAKTEKNRDLREKAIFWLGQSRDPKALKALSEIVLRSPEGA